MYRPILLLAFFTLGCGHGTRDPLQSPTINPDIQRSRVVAIPSGMKLVVWTTDGRKHDRCVYPAKTHGLAVKAEYEQGGASGNVEFSRRKDYATTPEGQNLLALAFVKCQDAVLGGHGDWAKLETFMEDSNARMADLQGAVARVERAEAARIERERVEAARVEHERIEAARVERERAVPQPPSDRERLEALKARLGW